MDMEEDYFGLDNENLRCPYCGEIQYTHDEDTVSADMCWTECEHCGKKFWYSVTVRREYDSYKDEEDDDEDESLERDTV